MTEPTTATATTSVIGLATLSVFFPGINEPILLGAFCGSMVFVLSSQEVKPMHKFAYMVLSLFVGLWGAKDMASILAGLFGLLRLDNISISPAIGALFCSSLIVQVLLYLTKLDWAKVLPFNKGHNQ